MQREGESYANDMLDVLVYRECNGCMPIYRPSPLMGIDEVKCHYVCHDGLTVTAGGY